MNSIDDILRMIATEGVGRSNPNTDLFYDITYSRDHCGYEPEPIKYNLRLVKKGNKIYWED